MKFTGEEELGNPEHAKVRKNPVDQRDIAHLVEERKRGSDTLLEREDRKVETET